VNDARNVRRPPTTSYATIRSRCAISIAIERAPYRRLGALESCVSRAGDRTQIILVGALSTAVGIGQRHGREARPVGDDDVCPVQLAGFIVPDAEWPDLQAVVAVDCPAGWLAELDVDHLRAVGRAHEWLTARPGTAGSSL
jgi:hypothetical protein